MKKLEFAGISIFSQSQSLTVPADFKLENFMKKMHCFSCFIFLALLPSCQSSRDSCDEVVCETVHRYGVPLEPEDWSERGKNGQVVSMRKDGVTVTRTYEDGVLHGDCTYSFPYRDVVQKKEVYNQGAVAEEVVHYSSGLPQRQTTHVSPRKQSVVAWYESGAPQSREEYANGELVQGEYYTPNQQIDSNVNESNGLRTLRDGQGQLLSVDTIQKGQKVLSTSYHSDGTPAAVTPYVKGKVEGERLTYLPGGEPSTIEKWSKNVQHGTTTVFEQGEKRADVPYVNGQKHGLEKRYRNGEEVAHEINWEQGQQHGPSYTHVGNSKQETWYFQGRQVPNKATFDMMSNQ